MIIAAGALAASSSGTFAIDWYSVDSGGGFSSGGPYSLGASAGQPDAGQMSGGDFTLNGGFWQCITDAVTASGIDRSGSDINLSWTAAVTTAAIYRHASNPYFTPSGAYASGATSVWTDSGAAGNPATNYTYLIRADGDCGESANSKRMGEFDFSLEPGS